MTAPERFADSQIPLAPRAPSIHDPSLVAQFAQALSAMSYDNPSHRPVLEAEGLRRWVEPQLDGYGSLRDAAGRQGLLKRPVSVET